MRSFIRFFLALGIIILGIAVIVWSFYVKFKYDMPWGSYKGSHISPWPGMLVFISLSGILWALGDLWLHGGPKARRQAKLDAQRQAQEASSAPPAGPEPLLGKSEEQTGQSKPEQRRD